MQKHIGVRKKILAAGLLAAMLAGAGTSYAWYARATREAHSSELEVMKPYYLTVFDYTGTTALNLTVGSLYPGEVKEIVICVSNKNLTADGTLQMGISDFDYSMELVYTENLTLQYKLFELEPRENPADADFSISEADGAYYWKKGSQELRGTDVSQIRWEQAGLQETTGSGDPAALQQIINKGSYTVYEKDGNDNRFHLHPESESGYAPDYYLLQIKWDDSKAEDFDRYLKETDMIYILVKALQPEPKKMP